MRFRTRGYITHRGKGISFPLFGRRGSVRFNARVGKHSVLSIPLNGRGRPAVYLNGVGIGVSAPTLIIIAAIIVGVVMRLFGG
jgi:hypothetical protein